MQGHKRVHHVNFLQPCYRGLQHFSFPEYSENSGKCISITLSTHVETVVLLSHKKPDGHINVKVEFGEGEGKVPLDNIAKRAEEYKPKERVTYKMIKEYIEAKLGKNQNVTLPVLLSICEYLKCDFGDIMEALPDDVDKERES